MILGDCMIVAFFVILMFRHFLKEKGLLVCLLLFTVFGQFYFSHKYDAFSEKDFIFPSHPVFSYLQQNQELNRFITAGDGYIMSEMPLYYHLYSPDGVSSMYPKRYGELVTYAIYNGHNEPIPRVETRINPKPHPLFLDNSQFITRFMQIDGIKYVVVRKADLVNLPTNTNYFYENWQLEWQDNTWQVFSYKNVLPRFFWTDSFKMIPEDKQLLADLFAKNNNPQTIFLEQDPGIGVSKNGKGEVTMDEYSPNDIRMHVNADTDGLVYLSDSYASNFKTSVDGKPTQLLRANYAFRAVPVTAGNHTIEMKYEDTLFIKGCMIAAVSLLVLLSVTCVLLLKKIIRW